MGAGCSDTVFGDVDCHVSSGLCCLLRRFCSLHMMDKYGLFRRTACATLGQPMSVGSRRRLSTDESVHAGQNESRSGIPCSSWILPRSFGVRKTDTSTTSENQTAQRMSLPSLFSDTHILRQGSECFRTVGIYRSSLAFLVRHLHHATPRPAVIEPARDADEPPSVRDSGVVGFHARETRSLIASRSGRLPRWSALER